MITTLPAQHSTPPYALAQTAPLKNIIVLLYAACWFAVAITPVSAEEIYRWRGSDGKWRFGDADSKPEQAEKITQSPTTIIESPPLPDNELTTQSPAKATAPAEVTTAKSWAAQNCRLSTRILYTERSFIPCVPTDEVQVYLCQREPPRKYRHFFGQQYHYEKVASQCGPEIYEAEILFLSK